MRTTDQHGNPMSGSTEAAASFDRAVDRLVRFHPEVVDLATELATEHPDHAMGQALVAYLHLMSTDQGDVATAAAAGATVASCAANDRERAHAEAIDRWARGDWYGAASTLDDLLVRWPTDLLALQMGHGLDFFLGDAANLRDRVARSRPAFDPAHPHFGYVDGMLAFGLEESGHYGAAEATGRAALDRNPDDVWGLHALAHTFEMQGRVDEGIVVMQERVSDWGSGNLFTVHNWWHLALYLLETGSVDGALAIYDTEVHHAGSADVSLELLDASSMLWRLALDQVEVGDRFRVLAEAWDRWRTDESWYVFNDFHAVVAYAGAERLDAAREVIARLESDVAAGGPGSNVAMTAEVGLPASRGIVAFAEGRFDDAVDALLPIRRRAHRFGGSHAQRDLIQRTVTDAAVVAGRHDLARALLAERLTLRPTSHYGAVRLDRLATTPAAA